MLVGRTGSGEVGKTDQRKQEDKGKSRQHRCTTKFKGKGTWEQKTQWGKCQGEQRTVASRHGEKKQERDLKKTTERSKRSLRGKIIKEGKDNDVNNERKSGVNTI